jgi:hypothetical protein
MVYKYEREVEERIKDLDWGAEIRAAKSLGLTDEQADRFIRTEFLEGASSALRASFAKHYRITEEGVIRITEHKEPGANCVPGRRNGLTYGLPVMEMPWITSDGGDGLYFIGMIGMNPEGDPYYLVKVGCSSNIKKRIAGYASMNPMIFHNNTYITEFDRGLPAEANCHRYLAENAYAIADRTEEWFYVTEEKYFELCGTFANKEMFKAIAEGRD